MVGSFRYAGWRPLKALCGLSWALAFLISSILIFSFMLWILIVVFFVMFCKSILFCKGVNLIFLAGGCLVLLFFGFFFDLVGVLQFSQNILFSRSALHLSEFNRFLFFDINVGIVGLSLLFIRFSELKRLF